MNRVAINPDMLRWARERARRDLHSLQSRFPKIEAWENGTWQPTLKQVQAFAHATHTPVGYLFLPEPPKEPLPIPDFRTIAGRSIARPSPDLLDTIYLCQERQGWYKEFARIARQPELDFVGSASLNTPPEQAAQEMRDVLGFDLEARRQCQTWEAALSMFISDADRVGIMVMSSGIVANNTRRHLNPEEFRGFALADSLAPLVFINGADTKAARLFTLAHELAHLWLGISSLSDSSAFPHENVRAEEVWCNRVAAELLAPLQVVHEELRADEPLNNTLSRLARRFKVSTLVILRRLLDANWITRQKFEEAYRQELKRLRELVRPGSGGGDFYRTELTRVSRRFAEALVVNTLEGQTLYRDAFRMLGIAKTETFHELGRNLGIPV